MARFDAGSVRGYYERHTGTFVALGQGGHLGTLHRAVWGPGVADRAQAFRYVEDRIAALARRLAPTDHALHVVDLGCGVGGSLCYLAERLPVRGTGITVSSTQARFAERRIRAEGLSDRVRVLEGDYGDLPVSVERADVAFAIESFVHAPDPARFFAQCRQLIRPGGALVICDDFRRPGAGGVALATIERFCRGWHINTLLEPNELGALAREAEFDHESTTELSAYVEIGRRRDRIVDLLAAALERLPWRWSRLDPWLGGSALQACLRNNWLGYDLVVFRKR